MRLNSVRADATADDVDLNPYPNLPRLTFRNDDTFKITVFSDLHYGENPWDAWGPQQDVNSTRLMNTVLSTEQPDYVSVHVLLYSRVLLNVRLQRTQRRSYHWRK